MNNQIADLVAPEPVVRAKRITARKNRKTLPQWPKLKLPRNELKQYPWAILNKLNLVSSYAAGLRLIETELNKAEKPVVVSFINAHGHNLCFKKQDFCKAILDSDIVFRDGKGMEILYRSAEMAPGKNMCGTDSIPLILDHFEGKSIALLGTAEPYLSNAVRTLTEQGRNVLLSKDGFSETEEYLEALKGITPDIILLGMGMPKQELLSAVLKDHLQYNCLIINGGAIIDHFGHKISRAPAWMRKRGLEWLYRLVNEPMRLFNRYIIGNVVFLRRVYRATGKIRF